MGEVATKPAIQLERISKRFSFTEEQPSTLLEQLIDLVRPRRKIQRHRKKLWAVKDVTLDVMPGQALGIIGRNGSGKSTLLKLIARILRPTKGRIVVRGRVSALLELGAGFHADLTGRENVYLNAAILGLSREEIDTHFDSVVSFSELEEFIDMPVKHYSSGMYMRLGFSVAIHVNPDILIVDEVLTVGDQAFQAKCINHIHQTRESGATIVLVSHNAEMIADLCSHVAWLEQGQMRNYGPVNEVLPLYQAHFAG